jgi:hypothetical protein
LLWLAVHAMAAGRKHMWSHSFVGAGDPQVCVQAGCARAKSAFWLSLHIFSLVHRHLPCKGWNVVGASNPFLYVSGQPQRLYVRLIPTALLLSLAIDACLTLLLVFLLGCRRLCLVLAVEAPMAVCVPSALLPSGLLCSLCWLVLTLCSQVFSTVLFVLMHALLLLPHCVPLFPFYVLRFWCFA